MKSKFLPALTFIMLASIACSTTAFPAPEPTAIAPAAAAMFTPIPTLTSVPEPALLSKSLILVSSPFNESGDGPIYAITAQTPQLQGSDDPRVAALNARMNEIVKNEVDKFRADILANQPVQPFVAGSSFDMRYTLLGQRDDVWSIKFEAMYFYDGAAHPGHYSITLNYDLNHGELTLDDLFLADANYLQFISDYCKAELATRDIGFTDPVFMSGADPLPENYQRWNLADEGFAVTFDEYQVAPYVAGAQTVIIPYADLRPVSNLNGVLQIFDR